MDLNKVKIDLEKEADGIWVSLDDDTSFCIARMYNPKFNKRFEKLSAPYRSAAKRGMMDDSKANDIMNQVIAETILTDWKGLLRNGVDVKYSVVEAKKILDDKRLAGIRQFVLDVAEDESNFRSEEITETGKKSKSISSGNDSGEKK